MMVSLTIVGYVVVGYVVVGYVIVGYVVVGYVVVGYVIVGYVGRSSSDTGLICWRLFTFMEAVVSPLMVLAVV